MVKREAGRVEKPSPAAEDGEYERCILCGKLTDVRRDEHISLREFYAEGAGQLCTQCWARIYLGVADRSDPGR